MRAFPCLFLAIGLALVGVKARAQGVAPPVASVGEAAAPVEIARDARSLGRTPSDQEVEEVEMIAVPVVISSVRGRIEEVTDIVRAGLGELGAALTRAELRPNGRPMTVFLQIGDTDFLAELMMPVATLPSPPPQGLRTGRSPSGGAIRIVHRGAYEVLDETYDQLATFIEDKDVPVREVVVERYMSDPETTASTDLVTEIYVLTR